MNPFKALAITSKTLGKGLSLTLKHLVSIRHRRKKTWVWEAGYFENKRGVATIQYPHETIPVPETGRYKLHNEIDDCIVCDKCVKVCPVNCITIEPIKSPEEFGRTSDGTPKRIYAAQFDIDMGKCCFCGLCTTVCPTACLTMTSEYDYSTFNLVEHDVAFATMTKDEIKIRKEQWASHAALPAIPPAKPGTGGDPVGFESKPSTGL
jgi:formate hydrogenlyase subunit 6/NADH:ubiquinone oxidoreductase subunit I